MNRLPEKIVILGPESTGKSTLCAHLAEHYNCPCCPEYAREYLLMHGNNYTYDSLLTISQKQLELEDKITSAARHHGRAAVFIDTNMYVMKVWCEFVFNKCHPWILEQIAERKYDHYLLCKTDLPWVKDELREYPDLKTRETLYTIYKEHMISQPEPWTEISGNHKQRLHSAIVAVDRLLAG